MIVVIIMTLAMIAEKIHIDMKGLAIALVISLTGLWTFIEHNLIGDFNLLITLIQLMLLDFITGITKSYVKGRIINGRLVRGWEAITSKGFRESFGKVVQYGAFIIVTQILSTGYIMSEHINNPEKLLTFAYLALYVTEVKSILENIVEINPSLTVLSRAVGIIKEVVSKIVKK